jgi:hypothetical protein
MSRIIYWIINMTLVAIMDEASLVAIVVTFIDDSLAYRCLISSLTPQNC